MISAIVLAAGGASRFGACKQLVPIDGKPLLEHVLETLRGTRVADVVVVLGANAAEIRERVRFTSERLVLNRDHAAGMSSSIQAGLRAVTADAALIVLGDQPFVRPETIDRLIAEYERAHPKAVVPMYGDARGNPVIIDRSLFAETMQLRGDVGCRAILAKYERDVVKVAVDDRGVITDIDTAADLERC